MNVSNPLKVKGFTLAELLAVIVIIAALVGVSAPIMLRQIEKGLETKALNTMKDLNSAISEYSADNHGFLPTNNTADGETDGVLDTATDKFFISTLTGGSDTYNNLPSKAYFIAPVAQSDDSYGIVGTGDAAWLADPWGRGYILLVDYNGDGTLDPMGANEKLKSLGITLTTSERTKLLTQISFELSRGGIEEQDESAGTVAYPEYLLNL